MLSLVVAGPQILVLADANSFKERPSLKTSASFLYFSSTQTHASLQVSRPYRCLVPELSTCPPSTPQINLQCESADSIAVFCSGLSTVFICHKKSNCSATKQTVSSFSTYPVDLFTKANCRRHPPYWPFMYLSNASFDLQSRASVPICASILLHKQTTNRPRVDVEIFFISKKQE